MWLKVEPLDVVMFRDSRPFAGGESHRARSVFPPTPLTFQGAIRSVLLNAALNRCRRSFLDYRSHCINDQEDSSVADLASKLGRLNEAGQLRLTGPLLAAPDGAPVFPVPRDILFADGEEPEARALAPLDREEFASISHDRRWPKEMAPLWAEAGLRSPGSVWITARGMAQYLAESAVGDGAFVESEALYSRDARTGIKLDGGRGTAESGMLYVADFIRLRQGVSFLCGVVLDESGDSLLSPLRTPGILQLGGEARAARYRPLDEDDPLSAVRSIGARVRESLAAGALLKLYLATPAVFNLGWLPDFVCPGSLEADLGGQVKLKLVAAAVGKPLPLGGWDLVHRRPKPMVQAVPPGSVYMFDVAEGEPEEVVEAFHCTSRLQSLAKPIETRSPVGWAAPEHLARFGFGLTFVGAGPSWPRKED